MKRLSIKEIHRRTRLHRQTIRRALRSEGPPRYERPPRPSKLDPFKEEVHRLLRAWRSSGSSGRRRPRSLSAPLTVETIESVGIWLL